MCADITCPFRHFLTRQQRSSTIATALPMPITAMGGPSPLEVEGAASIDVTVRLRPMLAKKAVAAGRELKWSASAKEMLVLEA